MRGNSPTRSWLATAVLTSMLAFSGPALAETPGGVSSDLERTESTTPAEKLAFAASSNQEIRDAAKTIEKLLEQTSAKKDADADALTCLKLKLTSVRALEAVSTSAEASMKSAITAGNDDLANHEYRKIAVAVSKTRVLLAEAQGCASGSQLESGTTIVDWESNLTDTDTTTEPTIDTTDFPPNPPPITPFQ